jgi:hypothetical protein
MMRYCLSFLAVFLLALGAHGQDSMPASPVAEKQSRFFELRTYHAAAGKMEALEARFRNYTNKLFVKHGIQTVGCWIPQDKNGQSEDKLIYLLAFPSRQARDAAWKEFTDDMEWQAVKVETEQDGRLVEKVDSVYMTALDFSAIK